MPSRRLEKVARVIQSTVSRVIQHDISDPRVQGLISVTRVEASTDLKNANVYLSILGIDDTAQRLCMAGINHAGGYIRSQLAREMPMKNCPALTFHLDVNLKERLKTMEILEHLSEDNSRHAGTETTPALPAQKDGPIADA